MKTPRVLCSTLLTLVAITFFAGTFLVRPPIRSNLSLNQQPKTKVELSGEQGRTYLEKTSDGESLMQALTAARFGLTWQEHAPGESNSGGGYLGMSHEQNLKAWFGEDGVTV